MKTDHELLELAAKAAGITFKWTSVVQHYTAGKTYIGPIYWNPLNDDTHALRLAVKLNLCVIRETIKESIVSVVSNLGTSSQLTAYRAAWEPLKNDPYAATRRAIVRAAAEIGETE